MKIKAIIFDMDGVLIEAKEWHYDALNKALIDFGLKPISRQDHCNKFDGLSTDQKLEIIGIDKNLHKEINSLKQEYTNQIAAKELKPTLHHIEMMERLKKNGYKIAVCSNSIKNTVNSFIEMAALKSYMSFLLSNEDVENKKPHPDIYIKAINNLNLSPKECIIVEDNFNGIKAAKASGAHVLEVGSVQDVNYSNIKNKIDQIENINNEKN